MLMTRREGPRGRGTAVGSRSLWCRMGGQRTKRSHFGAGPHDERMPGKSGRRSGRELSVTPLALCARDWAAHVRTSCTSCRTSLPAALVMRPSTRVREVGVPDVKMGMWQCRGNEADKRRRRRRKWWKARTHRQRGMYGPQKRGVSNEY